MWIKTRSAAYIVMILSCVFAATLAAQETSGYVTTADGVRLYYIKVGSGPDTVVIPSASCLTEDLKPLAKGRTLIFYDQRRTGQSDRVKWTKLGASYDISDLEAIRDHFGLKRMSLIGHSYTTLLVFLYASEHPNNVDRLIMVGGTDIYGGQPNSWSRTTPAPTPDAEVTKRIEQMEKEGENVTKPAEYARLIWLADLRGKVVDPAALGKMRATPWLFPNNWARTGDMAYIRFFFSIGGYRFDLRGKAGSLNCPVLIVNGTEDGNIGFARETAAAFPNARTLAIPAAGHLPWLDGAEAFFPAVEEFLSGKWPAKAEAATPVK